MKFIHMLLAVIVAAIWGCNFLFIKLGVNEIPPLFLCGMRFLLASIPAVFFIKRPNVDFKWVVAYGLITFGLQFAFMFSSFALGMTAGMASLIGQTQLFFGIFFAVLFLNEKLSIWQILGSIVAFSGIFLITQHVNTDITLPGVLLVISAAVVWGFGNLITKKIGKTNMLSVVIWGSLVACLPLFIMSFLIEGQDKILTSMHHFSWFAIISLLYIVYISTWIGYGVWNWLLSCYPVTMVAPFTFLIPIFGLSSSMLVLGETFETWKIMASILVISGLLIHFAAPKLMRIRKEKNIIPA